MLNVLLYSAPLLVCKSTSDFNTAYKCNVVIANSTISSTSFSHRFLQGPLYLTLGGYTLYIQYGDSNICTGLCFFTHKRPAILARTRTNITVVVL